MLKGHERKCVHDPPLTKSETKFDGALSLF